MSKLIWIISDPVTPELVAELRAGVKLHLAAVTCQNKSTTILPYASSDW